MPSFLDQARQALSPEVRVIVQSSLSPDVEVRPLSPVPAQQTVPWYSGLGHAALSALRPGFVVVTPLGRTAVYPYGDPKDSRAPLVLALGALAFGAAVVGAWKWWKGRK